MNTLNAKKAGLAVGALLGGWHVIWSLLVLTGLGQPLVNFILWAHMIRLTYVVGPFDAIACITLIIITSLVGFVAGSVFAKLWNWLHQQ